MWWSASYVRLCVSTIVAGVLTMFSAFVSLFFPGWGSAWYFFGAYLGGGLLAGAGMFMLIVYRRY